MKTKLRNTVGPKPGDPFKRYEKMMSLSKRFVSRVPRVQKTRKTPNLRQLLQNI